MDWSISRNLVRDQTKTVIGPVAAPLTKLALFVDVCASAGGLSPAAMIMAKLKVAGERMEIVSMMNYILYWTRT
jgi:hypothetical protein